MFPIVSVLVEIFCIFQFQKLDFCPKVFLLGKFNVCVWSMLLELSVSKWKGKY